MGTFKVQFQGVAKRVMVLMMIADGVIDQDEIQAIQSTYLKLTGQPISPKEIDQEVFNARRDGRSIEEFLSVLGLIMDDQDKAMVIKAAYLVAVSDGNFHDDEKRLILTIGDSLKMERPAINAAIQSAR